MFDWFVLTNTCDIQVLSVPLLQYLTDTNPTHSPNACGLDFKSHPHLYECILQYPIGSSRPPGTNTWPTRCHCQVDPKPYSTHPHQLIRRPEPRSNIEGPTDCYLVQRLLAFFRPARDGFAHISSAFSLTSCIDFSTLFPVVTDLSISDLEASRTFLLFRFTLDLAEDQRTDRQASPLIVLLGLLYQSLNRTTS